MMRANAVCPRASARNDAPMPQRIGELRQSRDAGRSGDAHMHRAVDALCTQRGDPAQDRRGFEAELCHQRHGQSALPRQRHLRLQRRIQRTAIDRRMSLGIAAERDAADAMALHHAGRQQIQAGTERPAGLSSPPISRMRSTPASPAARCRKSLAWVKLASRRAATCGTGTKPARRSRRRRRRYRDASRWMDG